MRRIRKRNEFQKIEGVKKIVRCVGCGQKIFVQNLNQMKCAKCGYRGVNKAET